MQLIVPSAANQSDTNRVRPAAKRRSLVFGIATAAIAVGIDQASKALALQHLEQAERIPLLGDVLGLQLAFNPGSAFSLGTNATWLLTVLSAVASIGLFFVLRRITTSRWGVTIGLIWGGAVGNLLDRLFAPPGFGRGYVTDFLAYGNLFIGNVADIALVVGVAAAVLLTLTSGPSQTASAEPPTPHEGEAVPDSGVRT